MFLVAWSHGRTTVTSVFWQLQSGVHTLQWGLSFSTLLFHWWFSSFASCPVAVANLFLTSVSDQGPFTPGLCSDARTFHTVLGTIHNGLHTLSKSTKLWCTSNWWFLYFSSRILTFVICSTVLLPLLNPACSSAKMPCARDFNLLLITVSRTLLGWLMRLIVLYLLHFTKVPFLWQWYYQRSCPL